jgi:hypothetical protein
MKLQARKFEFENFQMFEDLTSISPAFLVYVTKQNINKKTFKHLKKKFQPFTYLGYSKNKNVWLQQMIIYVYAKDFTISCINTIFFLLLGVGP